MAEHAAVVLAAGLSRRLGRPKQLLCRDGVSLLRRCVGCVLATGPVTVVVVVPAGRPMIAAEVEALPVTCVFNNAPQTGIAGSLRAAATALAMPPAATLIVGVDQVHLRRAHLEALLAAPEGDAVSGYGAAWGLPVRVGPATLARVEELTGDAGFKTLWSRAATPPHRVEAAELAFDLDTPEALDTAIAAGWIDR